MAIYYFIRLGFLLCTIILGIRLIILLKEDTFSNIRQNFYDYLETAIYFSIMLLGTILLYGVK